MSCFYCRPLTNVTKDSVPWGIQNMVRDMCLDAGIEGRKTNHSLRVSGTTSLFAEGVPERIIQSRTGHSSLEALRKYKDNN